MNLALYISDENWAVHSDELLVSLFQNLTNLVL
jgi:hypothetical protein